jgi:hypothetical protein
MKEWVRNSKYRCRLPAVFLAALLFTACDKIPKTSSGGGGGDETNTAAANVADDSNQPTDNNATPAAQNRTVVLDAFKDFDCTSNWTNRDGGLGLTVGSGSGTCQTTFPGGSGTYRIELAAQTEREGQSPYRITINGTTVGAGKFPFSQGERICECYRQPWMIYCPDVIMDLDVGAHQINTGDVIEYYGEEEYLCGKHGAYSKWRGMRFTPVN